MNVKKIIQPGNGSKNFYAVTSQVFVLISNWCNIKVVLQSFLYELNSVLTYNSLSRIMGPENKTHGSSLFFSPYFPRVRSVILALHRSHYFENMKQATVTSEKYPVPYCYKKISRERCQMYEL